MRVYTVNMNTTAGKIALINSCHYKDHGSYTNE